jgi:DNA-binding CsgD family transcriptional regulator
MGKTALLNAAEREATATGQSVLRTAGVQFEAEMAFSGLHQALLPLHQQMSRLSATHQDALNAALGFSASAVPDRTVVSSATLSLLRLAAAERPVLTLVDDLPWLDRASAGVLEFVAHHVNGSRVGFLAGCRSGEAGFFDRAGLAEHELAPLDDQAASKFMSACFPGLAAAVRERLLVEAQGNPLALLELPSALSGAQRTAVRALPAVLPLSRRLQRLFSSKVTELPDPTRRLLLLMALDGTGDLRVLGATGDRSSGLADLAPAELARLAYVDEQTHRLVFRHPMIRTAVVELSTDQDCRRAHATLAELWADQPDRRAWHLGEATIQPDEDVAAELEQAAHRILRRGDATGAVAALSRASDLSPGRADRSRRLADAAYIGADVTGDLHGVSALLDDARRSDPDVSKSLPTSIAASYLLLNGDGDVNTAHRLLVGAIGEQDLSSGPPADAYFEALHNLLEVCLYGGRRELWEPFDATVARVTPGLPEVLDLWCKTMADPVRHGASALGQLSAAIGTLGAETDPTRIERIATAGVFLDRISDCREALWRVVRDGRQGGAVASAINALMLLSFDDFHTGRWDELLDLAHEGLELCELHGYGLLTWPILYSQAMLAAARGDGQGTRALTDQMDAWAAPRGVRAVQWYSSHARALAALGSGDAEYAYQHAITITTPGTIANHFGQTLWIALDLVEAAARTGRHAEAAAHVTAMQTAGIDGLSSRLAFLLRASAAIAASDDTALGLFEEALAIAGLDRWPFDLARVQLIYGERLRRARAMTESRSHLAAALDTFTRLGAQPWANRASNELRATGQVKPRGEDRDRDALTPQELEIALLAASGLSNKQIAARLSLSHRTVGAHLYRIFPKLGITSRAALRDALAAVTDQETTN